LYTLKVKEGQKTVGAATNSEWEKKDIRCHCQRMLLPWESLLWNCLNTL